ncbi:DUF368 domain-containing protein [Feifania hominis]|uniref:DUF368 domain-containing protein n=1 Tax=Feifania hominis TaxID=2763660 RepID=A0A926DDP0_9FIRM|nr:DUF368 domain-containing protein [Feifania hominis]MBC8537055.1 DUF368 domain-containing protein [Feifania hominis]
MRDRHAPLYGFVIGGSMLVPGVSGGSMAILLGIYDRLLSAVGSFRARPRENARFLALFCAGALAGMVLVARPLLALVELFPRPTLYFFLGVVAGSLPLLVRTARLTRLSWKTVLFPLAGLAVLWALSLLPPGFAAGGGVSFWKLLLAGAAAAVALVLPGISVSYLFLLLGMYDTVMAAIAALDFALLVPLGVGGVLGIVLTARLLERLLTAHPQASYLTIFGFVLGSIAEVFPGLPSGWELVVCAATALAGAAAVRLLSRYAGA